MKPIVPLSWALLLSLTASACFSAHGTIGALLTKAPDGRVTVRDAPHGLAAANAELIPGDEILLIDGVAARDLSPKALHQKLTGEVGDPVKLTVLRGERVIRVTLRRTPAQRFKSGPSQGPGVEAPRAE